MSKQISVCQQPVYHWRKVVAAIVLAVALTSLPALATSVPGPLSSLFAQPAYACPVSGSCG